MRVIHLKCDGLGCSAEFHDTVADYPMTIILRQRASKKGWNAVPVDGMDYCPACVMKAKRALRSQLTRQAKSQ